MLPYENLTGIPPQGVERIARAAMRRPEVAKFFDRTRKDTLDRWIYSDQAIRSKNYHDHSWDFLDPILLALSSTGSAEYFEPALYVATDWSEHFANLVSLESPVGETNMAWYDMAVGLRAYRLAYILDVALRNDVDSTLTNILEQSLDMHASYLADDKNIKFHNNHGFFQAAGQLAMGRRFAERSSAMEDALTIGEKRVSHMLAMQFSPEGVHLEHSPDYHRMVHRTARRLVDEGLIKNETTISFIEKIERALSWFVLPSGRVADIGDSDIRCIREAPSEARRRWKTEEMRYVASRGLIGKPPKEPIVRFEEGGYMIARVSHTPDEPFQRQTYLLQQAGFHSRTHKHADHQTFIWSDRGRQIIVDAGRYGYVGRTEPGSKKHKDGFWYDDPNRMYCESTRAHNCLEFDGRDYSRRNTQPFGSAVRRTFMDVENKIIAMESSARLIEDVQNERLLVLSPGQWLLCIDNYSDLQSRRHDIVQWFHFAPWLHFQKTREGDFVSRSDSSTRPLRARALSGDIDGTILLRGSTEPRMQGWHSSGYRKIIPNDALGLEHRARERGTLATLFCFAESLETPVASSFAAKGRAGELAWTIDGRAIQLAFDRTEGGQMKIEVQR